MPGSLRLAFAVVLAGLVAVAVATAGSGGPAFGGREATFGEALADPVPYDGRSPAEPAGRRERVLVELPRPALGELADAETMSADAQRAYVASLRDEADALLSALAARGVKTSDVVTYERVWHGFAATVAAKDLPGLESLGARLRPNRRFYPAVSQPVAVRGAGVAHGDTAPGAAAGPAVALLAGGAVGDGYDAVGRDADPAPARGEVGGQVLADVLAGLGARVRVIRVSALRRPSAEAAAEEYGRTDELLDGLEHAVDPNRDGDTSDHARVALIGVSAPYAGFAGAPEARAADGALRLGTLVVAPSGHEGGAAGPLGTIGSPAAAGAALAATPLGDPAAVPRTRLTVGPVTVTGAAVLAHAPPPGTLRTSAPVQAADPAALPARGAPPLDGRLAVVRAGDNPGAQAAAAAAAGARAVLLAEVRPGRELPALPAGRVGVPVLGVTGPAATAILELDPGAPATAGPATAGRLDPRRAKASRFTSEGPAFSGAAKPDLARPGSALVGNRLVTGAAVAAARVAVEAARLDEAEPQAARQRLLAGAGTVPGRRAAGGERVAVPVSRPELRRHGRATGVRFSVGRFERGDAAAGQGTTIVPADRLDLTLRRADGSLVERLTPPGGERGVLPGAYAYTLPAAVVGDLAPGAYVFRVRALAPGQRRPTVVTSKPFEVK